MSSRIEQGTLLVSHRVMSIYDPLACSSCGSLNDWLAAYCLRCGSSLKPSNKPSPLRRNSPIHLLAIGGLAVVLLLAFIIGKNQNREERLIQENRVAATPIPTPAPKLTSAEKLDRAKRIASGNPSNEQMWDALKLLKEIPKSEKESKESVALEKRITEKLSRNMAEEMLLGPKPVSSAWDGTVYCVDRYLKDVLNDYDDSEYLEWSPVARIYLKKEPYWAVSLKLRARNGFGAKIVKQVVFLIRRNQVVTAKGL